MRKALLTIAISMAVLPFGSLFSNRAEAMGLGTQDGINLAIEDTSAVEQVRWCLDYNGNPYWCRGYGYGGYYRGGFRGGFRGGGRGGFRGGGRGGFRGGGGGRGGRRSDIALKHDIVLLGHLDNGLGFYRFSYNGSDKAYVGVMAQEAQSVKPEAVVRDRDGYLRVYYERLGLRFQTWDAWVNSGQKIPATAVSSPH